LASDSVRLGYRFCSPCVPTADEPPPSAPSGVVMPRRTTGLCANGLHSLAVHGQRVPDRRLPAGFWIRCGACRRDQDARKRAEAVGAR